LIAALGGTSSGTGILNSLGVGGLSSIFNSIGNAFSGGTPTYTGPDIGTNPDVPSNWFDNNSYD
jgi:hypothetical protein